MERLINNMKNRSLFLMLGIFLLFSLTFVAAQTDKAYCTSNGMDVVYKNQPTLKASNDFSFSFHIYNKSNGAPLTNTSSFCALHIYNSSGTHIITNSNLNFGVNSYDFYLNAEGNNFTNPGEYSFVVACFDNDFTISAECSDAFIVTKTGSNLNSSESLIYIILALGVFLLFALSFYFLISTPYQNDVNEKGAVIKITKLKYVKLGLVLLTWVLFTWLLNILIGLSDNFVSLTMYYGLFGFIFDVMNRLSLPLGIVVLVISLFELVRDANIYGNIKKFGSAYK